ncbi:hypothetical protein QJS10_CPB17g02233 [Acorus calamus]|uniref:Uncharacterized protein n=1 Tax=Acorus calamus TaxID=4465 RepID=A0AAV9CVK0_ACOCL|nr:hypothetical protein QJS10_CPB17g02233 [Acorus calamus]
MASFLLSYLSGFLRSLLVEMGIGEDLFYPLAIFLLLFLVLAGAWFGFWGVRKFVLTEDGSVDENVASFVEWSIYIFASVMIFQSSLDRLFAAEALAFWIVISAVTKRISWPQVLHPLNMPSFSTPERIWQRSDDQDSTYNIDHTGRHMHETRNFSTPKNKSTRLRSHIRDSPQKNDLSGHVYETWNPDSFQSKIRSYTPNSRSSPMQGIDRTPSQYSSDQDMYYSSFHKTPDRKRFSKKEWEEFTQDSTKKALQGLVSTPDFSEWAIAHADRITLTPSADSNSATNQQKRRWFHWF